MKLEQEGIKEKRRQDRKSGRSLICQMNNTILIANKVVFRWKIFQWKEVMFLPVFARKE